VTSSPSAGTDKTRPDAAPAPLRLAILVGQDSSATSRWISTLASVPDVRLVGILFDTRPARPRVRLRNLRRNLRREGVSYLWFRLGRLVNHAVERLAARLVSQTDVLALLQRAFPERPFCLAQVAERHGIPVLEMGDLNGPSAATALARLRPDLGVVLGTRLLKRSTFAVPRLGCLNLHLGKVPEYRGVPPGFWEHYDRQRTAGVTVHFIDDGLDTGDVLGEDSVAVDPLDSPETLRRRLEIAGGGLLVRCVRDLARGCATPRPQPRDGRRPRTAPTRLQDRELHRRLHLPAPQRPAWVEALKTVAYLLVYHGGLFHLVRGVRRILGTRRACVLLYHRVNDLADDPLTTPVRRFAEHMLVVTRHYSVVPTSALVEKIRTGEPLPHDAVAIHFDDCYRDVYTQAAPILACLHMPAGCFVSSGYVGTVRRFPHDAATCPWIFDNLSTQDLVTMANDGFEVGSHTVNHVDLGQCPREVALHEAVQSRLDLEAIVGKAVTLFSYPFGAERNIRPDVVDLIRRSGYEAIFSAHGGYVTRRSSVFDLPRVGVSGRTRPLDLLMEIEGLSLGALRRRWQRTLSRWRRP
jgi:peptidoglycan/xylan/chitin deacetylase (PgdA/CDA1 family)